MPAEDCTTFGKVVSDYKNKKRVGKCTVCGIGKIHMVLFVNAWVPDRKNYPPKGIEHNPEGHV